MSVESGIGWIPHCLESIDFLYREEFEAYEAPEPRLPDAFDMFRRVRVRLLLVREVGPGQLLEVIGVDNVLWETDFPHSTALHPNPVERAAENLKNVPREHVQTDHAGQHGEALQDPGLTNHTRRWRFVGDGNARLC